MGGGPTLFGIASIINHISELLAYFFSNKILLKFGYSKILYIGLGGNVLRFLYISLIIRPWWVLPVEVIQGKFEREDVIFYSSIFYSIH